MPVTPEPPGSAPAVRPAAGPRSLAVLNPRIQPGVGIARSGDRRIAFAGLAVAVIYLALAVASLLLPPPIRLGSWLPVHLVLAGAASTAIAAVLPFFTAALVVAPPARPAIRIGGIGFVAMGALAVMLAYGQARGETLPATLAGGMFLAGLGLVAVATFGPIRGALGPKRVLFLRAYALALAYVMVGATIATLLIGGNGTVGAAWGSLKPAHAWLNLIGFAGLVIVTTLLHLAPTVAGTRLRPRASGRLAVVGIAVGAPLVAAGYATELDLLARTGAVATLAGAVGVAAHGVAIHFDHDRGRWTTDHGWHRFASLALLAGQVWLAAGVALAAARVLGFGAAPAGWLLAPLVGPLIVGGVAQILVGAMTHLLPAIGPGDPVRHAAQRQLLGRAATIRLAALNAGAILLTAGLVLAPSPGLAPSLPGGILLAGATSPGGMVAPLGLALVALGGGATLALLAVATRTRG